MIISLDIETIPNPAAVALLPEPTAKRTLKDPAKIAADIAEKKAAANDGAALDPMTGRVACYAMVGIMDDKLAEYTESAEAATDDAERALLQSMMRVLGGEDVRLVTWNGIGFDLPYVYKRALILDVYPAHFGAPPLSAWTKRYSTERHYDLMQVWGGWSSQGFEKLDTVAALVLAERKVAIDVTTFADLMESADGRAKMEEYCLQDTRLTWRLFEKMNKILFA
jgi:predicted PolB exonuclease-like 3'-5' exonuclease